MMECVLGFFRDALNDFQSIDADSNILRFYVGGLMVGIVLTSLIAYFPGKPFGIPYGFMDTDENTEKEIKTHENEPKPPKIDQPLSSGWAGDKIPKKDLDKLQKKFDLTDEQMCQVMKESRKKFQGLDSSKGAASVHRQLNIAVYVIILAGLCYVIDRDYDNFISFWFARYFPKEAKTLGLYVPEMDR